MSILTDIKAFLRQPFPEPENFYQEIKGSFTAGLIVSFILYVLKPFGFDRYEGSTLLLSLGFGAVTVLVGILVSCIYIFIRRKFSVANELNFGKWLFVSIIQIVFIAIGNLIFLNLVLGGKFSFSAYTWMLFNTALIGIFPLTFFGMRTQLKAERANNSSAEELNENLDQKKPTTENLVLAVEAMQNYVNIYSIESGDFQKSTERLTLKACELNFSAAGLIKCHRSYLVNPKYVQSVSGNAQGLKLQMIHESCPLIPVSRSFISKIKSELQPAELS